MADKPEEHARAEIDRLLAAAGSSVLPKSEVNIHEFPLKTGYGPTNYLLFKQVPKGGRE